jgi:hypothetical protein
MEKVIFEPNKPVRLALKFADGKLVEGRFGDQMYYTLADGRCMYVNTDIGTKINLLELRVGEPFEICKYWSRKKGDSPKWDVRRVDATPRAAPSATVSPAAAILETDLERDLRRSLKVPQAQEAGAGAGTPAPSAAAPVSREQPLQHRNNGYGNKPNWENNGQTAFVGEVPPPVPTKIPLNIAFREILGFCTSELQAAHEQWSDAARQDLVSTLLIQAAREGWCTIWQRGGK